MLSIGVFAFRALCMLAKPLPSPGPRCNKLAAALPVPLAYPSAAPVTTPSNKPKTGLTSGWWSIAATKCISEVPGLAKTTSKPLEIKVFSKASAEFIGLL